MPKVSVIIPVYGVEKYIERCARSLFEQTLDDIEYLFIDDCTPDDSITKLKQILEEYPNRKSQVIIHKMEKNSGQAAVREWGMRNATGEYVIHCDSDDWVDADMYRQMYYKAIKDGADCVICDYAVSDGINILRNVVGCNNTDKNDFIQKLLIGEKSWALWNKLFKRTLLNNTIYPKGDMGEDMVITIQCLLNTSAISYLSSIFYYYFQNPKSITNVAEKEKVMKNFYQNKENLDLLINIFRENGLYQKYEKEFVSCKYRIRNILVRTFFDKEIRLIWKNTYLEIRKKILLNPYLTKKDKLKFILINIEVYPWIKR